MESADPEVARRQLQKNYEQMTEGELNVVAEDAYDLTDLAREALQAEIARRGLNIELKTPPPPPHAHTLEDDLIPVTTVWSLAEATRVKNRLDDAAIPSYLGPDNLTDLNDFKFSFDGGVELKVNMGDQRRAIPELARRWPEDTDFNVLCPKCHSPEIVFQGREVEATDNPEAVDDTQEEEGVPADAKFNWSCDACGYQWEDNGIEQSA